jgi:hypothetical protein
MNPQRGDHSSAHESLSESSLRNASGKRLAAGDAKRLLDEVLGETLSRRQESPGELLQVLRHWRATANADQLQAHVMPELVRTVLQHRLGSRCGKLPQELFAEIGQVIWENESGRRRVERLWNALGAGQ